MKTFLLTLCLSVMMHAKLSAQCAPVIPPLPGHVKITGNQTITATGTVYWVCDNVHLTVSYSPGSVFYLETNAQITILTSDDDQVYAKPGCVINNQSSADISVVGDIMTITMNNTGSGSIWNSFNCSPLIYDYSLVGGSSGCTTPVHNEEQKLSLEVYPNPVINNLNLTQPVTGNLEIWTATGVCVSSTVVYQCTTLPVDYLPQGIYFLIAGERKWRFIK